MKYEYWIGMVQMKPLIKLVLLVITTISIISCSEKVDVPELNEIKSAQLIPEHGGFGADSFSLDVNNSTQNAIIEKVLDLVKASDVVNNGEKQNQFGAFSWNPTKFIIKMKNGDTIEIEPAIDAITTKSEDGSVLTQGQKLKDQVQVSIHRNESFNSFRLTSDELVIWIDGSWKQDIH
ncbi:hypothetical protein QFZ81_003883 [Paenibacillus sp. V4I9]|uniref:hypothetical protein n=1 Tax=Paenibacillus sp. V4I9 TaxID=3042308 RepID=UPI00277FFF33|nr:hypothetical protein [Paenibacillus sp. V4I9]MDQ0888795.1 hypothetical protein [Paenibacillus sp. V4I9]